MQGQGPWFTVISELMQKSSFPSQHKDTLEVIYCCFSFVIISLLTFLKLSNLKSAVNAFPSYEGKFISHLKF